ncbi:MAG TPA: GNAT family N-acetyltransferase [Glaciihabitans sp.]|nr:GNAT family N-acetyltransferase [Glaciihabitans sp.]
MADYSIREITIPPTVNSPEAADFLAAVELRNLVEAHGYGSNELSYGAAELLPGWQDNEHAPARMFGLFQNGRLLARGTFETRRNEGMDAAWVSVAVHPEFRHRGMGTALAEFVETLAREQNRPRLLVYTVSPDAPGERLPSPTGFGSVPLENAEVRFLTQRGFRLEQVERVSRLPLPLEMEDLKRQLADAQARSGEAYRLHYWRDFTPAKWRDDMARLLTRMSTDAPSAGLEEPEDVWSVERLIADEEREQSSPRAFLTVAAEHVASASLVGFSVLSVPAETSRAVMQDDTLVLRDHRGHRLGMLLKLANLAHLQRVSPGHPSVITFNAEENRPMLSVNEAVGFVPVAYEGAWRKDLV